MENESENRNANQKQLMYNIYDNVKSGEYEFSGGPKQFEIWVKRAQDAKTEEENSEVLDDASRWMIRKTIKPK